MDDEDIHEDTSDSLMGEGRNPNRELLGWANKKAWAVPESSDVGLDIPEEDWEKDPRDKILDKPLIRIGETERKKIPIFLSESDNRPDQKGGALFLHADLREKENKDEN
jgi:hypothetical protein